jgi:hypothetical protein
MKYPANFEFNDGTIKYPFVTKTNQMHEEIKETTRMNDSARLTETRATVLEMRL